MADVNSIFIELRSIRESLESALDRVNDLIDDVNNNGIEVDCKLEKTRGNITSPPDSFSEDKEKFIAP